MLEKLKVIDFLRAGNPMIWVHTHEVERCIHTISQDYKALSDRELAIWDSIKGCKQYSLPVAPHEALNTLADPKTPGGRVLFMVNLHLWFQNPQLIQAFRSHCPTLKAKAISIVAVGPSEKIPMELERDFAFVRFELPDADALNRTLDRAIGYSKTDKNPEGCTVDEDTRKKLVHNATGLTDKEAEDAFVMSYILHREIRPDTVFSLKAQMVEKNASSKMLMSDNTFLNVFGLDNAKEWLKNYFSDENLDLPWKGCVMVGVPGCGKDALGEALGNEVGYPVLDFSFDRIRNSKYGETQEMLRSAIAVWEAMAPCIVKISEIEKGLAGTSGMTTDSGVTKETGGIFLNWLNDHKSKVFVYATCNSLEELPAEYLRAGRWDIVFFVDIPNKDERKGIADLYCKKFHGKPLAQVSNFPDLDNYTGAEIMQVCIEAKRQKGDWKKAQKYVVPLYRSKADYIKNLRNEAEGKWVNASKSFANKVFEAVEKRHLEQ